MLALNTRNMLKDMFEDFCMAEADYAFGMWQIAHDNGKRKSSEKWLGRMEMYNDVLDFIEDLSAAATARWLSESKYTEPVVQNFYADRLGQCYRLAPVFNFNYPQPIAVD